MTLMSEMSARAKAGNYFIGIIDGTGPVGDDLKGPKVGPDQERKDYKNYDIVMEQGFCKQISRALPNKSLYLHGPAGLGGGLEWAVARMVREAERQVGKEIILCGYSRGALGVLMVAERLKAKGKNVYAAILLDPVDRYAHSLPYKFIPNNISATFLARRKLNAYIVLKYAGTMGTAPAGWPGWKKSLVDVLAPSNPIRPSFSSTALKVEPGGSLKDPSFKDQHVSYEYTGSHGAMGGVGYHWVTEDKTCQDRLVEQLNPWLSKLVSPAVTLRPGWDETVSAPRFSGIARALVAAGSAQLDLSFTGISRLDSMIYEIKIHKLFSD